MLDFPLEIIFYIADYLDDDSLCSLIETCSSFLPLKEVQKKKRKDVLFYTRTRDFNDDQGYYLGSKTWFINHEEHSIRGRTSNVQYYLNGSIKIKRFLRHGEIRRDGVYLIGYQPDGKLKFEVYGEMGHLVTKSYPETDRKKNLLLEKR